jgi:hypothetical protein
MKVAADTGIAIALLLLSQKLAERWSDEEVALWVQGRPLIVAELERIAELERLVDEGYRTRASSARRRKDASLPAAASRGRTS